MLSSSKWVGASVTWYYSSITAGEWRQAQQQLNTEAEHVQEPSPLQQLCRSLAVVVVPPDVPHSSSTSVFLHHPQDENRSFDVRSNADQVLTAR